VSKLLLLALLAAPSADTQRHIEERFIAPCCWSESVAVHRSEVAAEMRAEIQKRLAAGQSEDQIVSFFVSKYGERILMEPRGANAVWLTMMPWVALVLGLLMLTWFIRRRSAREPAQAARSLPPLP
jgi:cytochrome c-type biogenesis protein CcmH